LGKILVVRAEFPSCGTLHLQTKLRNRKAAGKYSFALSFLALSGRCYKKQKHVLLRKGTYLGEKKKVLK